MVVTQKKQLGQILIDAGIIDSNQLEEALQYKRDHNVYFGKAIIAMGLLTEKELVETLSDQLELPFLDLMSFEIQNDVLKLVEEKLTQHYKIMPIFNIGSSLTIATSDPLNVEVIDELSQKTGMEINLVLATESDIEQAIDLYYGAAKYVSRMETKGGVEKAPRVVSQEISEDTEIIEAVNMLFNEAMKIGASDIHLEPREQDVRIRFRVDGVLQQYYTVPKASMSPFISRVKILAGMDIAESRKPQDGRFTHKDRDNKIDVRTSTFPTSNGEKAVMRILDESRGKIELHKLGFSDDMLKEWRRVIHIPNGIILVSGPTGSGKTTTLYATLNLINSVEVNLMTIEDPIEYKLGNINQAQVNPKAGLSFATALRSMLRQDPDIIMVGEMRDVETIELTIRAALTGHLVFSTIHTNDAASSFTRVLDMGIDAFLVSSSVRAILAQRLIRLLCPRCKQEVEPTVNLLKLIGFTGDFKGQLFKPVGCVHCRNSGYFGRAGVFELLIPNEEIMELVNRHAVASEIEEAAVRNGMVTLHQTALHYVVTGRTSSDEMMRVTLV
ncbi:MAG: Flp pilus assembly complex ATPase component TadA [Candidatus Marinimicrobia bacterium]|nr:Flp pilus assembly complex ATPase component TadA [Candidatus Neomarinimicrobiota bacterium]MBL7046661.1 Flp pilus assembly complex ATPase component TadA [Candidatus Neomarinimicrobiota bacterium]